MAFIVDPAFIGLSENGVRRLDFFDCARIWMVFPEQSGVGGFNDGLIGVGSELKNIVWVAHCIFP